MIKSFSRLVLCVALVTNFGCAHTKPMEEAEHKAVSEGRCDDALLEHAKKESAMRLENTSKQAAGTVLSYSLTGASYTAEVLLDIAGGTVMTILLCSPQILVSGALALSGTTVSSSSSGSACIPGDIGALSSPPLGRQTFKSTKNFRCPSVVPLSKSIREVAGCYVNKGDQSSLVKARQNLNALQSSKDVYECLPNDEKVAIEKASNEINLKLVSFPADP